MEELELYTTYVVDCRPSTSADRYETSVGERTGGSTGTGPAGLEYPNDAFVDMVGQTRLTLSLEGTMHVNS